MYLKSSSNYLQNFKFMYIIKKQGKKKKELIYTSILFKLYVFFPLLTA